MLKVSKINHRLIRHLKELKIPSRASRSKLSLTDQQIFKIQTFLASCIANHVICITLITPVHMDALIPTVTTRPGKYRTIA
jgi:hypothetical protein